MKQVSGGPSFICTLPFVFVSPPPVCSCVSPCSLPLSASPTLYLSLSPRLLLSVEQLYHLIVACRFLLAGHVHYRLLFSSVLYCIIGYPNKERGTQFVFWTMSVMCEGRWEGGRRKEAQRRGGIVKVTVWRLVKSIRHKGDLGRDLPTFPADLFEDLTLSQQGKMLLCKRTHSNHSLEIKILTSAAADHAFILQCVMHPSNLVPHYTSDLYFDKWYVCTALEYAGGCLGWSKYRLTVG